jgi:hypothetical protein
MNTPYLIKIDPKSIKRNPNAGNTVYRQVIGTETEEAKVYYGNGSWHREQYFNGMLAITESVQAPRDKNVMECLPVGWHSSRTERQLFDTMYSLHPEPNYHFKYEDTLVQCESCKAIFPHGDLESWNDEDSEGNYYYSDRVCPFCDEHDCCSLRYEELDQTTGLIK